MSLLCGDGGREAGLSGGDESTSTGSSSLILTSGVDGRDMSRAPALCGDTNRAWNGDNELELAAKHAAAPGGRATAPSSCQIVIIYSDRSSIWEPEAESEASVSVRRAKTLPAPDGTILWFLSNTHTILSMGWVAFSPLFFFIKAEQVTKPNACELQKALSFTEEP